ncbi:hypothetical protein ACQP1G_17150 [Nocardia sp. CA-107356]|uniref:hypothetical protein n=1 Tax=Nocardia sp. CA-107356 TaxID=3239972 RepID=UPI003D94846A
MSRSGDLIAGQLSPGWPSALRVPLPEPEHLLAGICGHLTAGAPLIGWARELGDLHAELIAAEIDSVGSRRSADFDEARTHAEIDRIIGEIDTWAALNVPCCRSARRHTHSLGEVISHIAWAYAQAWRVVLHSRDTELCHRAWSHLAETREGYASLLTEIRTGHTQLPRGWRGIPHEHT